jgi:AraC-like DNA-binding protein
MHAPTLRAALQVCSRFNSLVIDDGYMFLSERGTAARLRCEFSRGAAFSTTYAEFALSGLMRMLLEFGAARTQVSAVYFEHVRPAHYAAYARVFGERVVHFEHSFTGIDFAREILDRPRMLHHAELYQLFEAQAVRSLELLPQPRSLLDQLEKYLAAHPMARIPDLMQAARDLNTSTRSLRRQLAREGVSYRDVMQGARQRGAVRLLHDPKRTLQEIANELGFADASSFNRAFKRWTGRTPGQYRAGMAASSCGADAVITPTPMSRARTWTAEG